MKKRRSIAADYLVPEWSENFFGINQKGQLACYPIDESPETSISLKSVVDKATAEGVDFPFICRFHDLLSRQISRLCQSFQTSMTTSEYKGSYRPLYPIKVNQMREVVEEVLKRGPSGRSGLGLEVGSKTELMAAMAYSDYPNSLIVCNGHKDWNYFQLAAINQKLKRKTIIVLEGLGRF